MAENGNGHDPRAKALLLASGIVDNLKDEIEREIRRWFADPDTFGTMIERVRLDGLRIFAHVEARPAMGGKALRSAKCGIAIPADTLPEYLPARKPIEECYFSTRVAAALEGAEVETLGDLAAKPRRELLALPKFGARALGEVEQVLAEHGLGLLS